MQAAEQEGGSTQIRTANFVVDSRTAAPHILDRTQKAIAQRFFSATKHANATLNGEPFFEGKTSAPILQNLPAYLECKVMNVREEYGDRAVVVLEVVHKPAFQRHEKPVWTPEQVRSILEAVPRVYRALFACAALTGARLGELLGLQWRHFDLKNRTLRIEQSLWQRQLVAPKTSGSIRTVPFGEALAKAVLEHRENAAHCRPEDFVFCKRDVTPLNPDVLRKDVLYPALDRSGIPRASRGSGFHTFRHSAASFINWQTGNLKLAQKLLGHATIDMTADVYTHTSAEADREAALAVERAIYGDLFVVVRQTTNTNSNAAVN